MEVPLGSIMEPSELINIPVRTQLKGSKRAQKET